MQECVDVCKESRQDSADCCWKTTSRKVYLNILSHAQVVSLLARVFTPDVGGDGAEEAHQQLHADDQCNLEVEEAIIRPWLS